MKVLVYTETIFEQMYKHTQKASKNLSEEKTK